MPDWPRPRGRAIEWTDEELRQLADVTDADLEMAARLWEQLVRGPLRSLPRARPYMPSEFVPDVD